jgi:hypothetical protein
MPKVIYLCCSKRNQQLPTDFTEYKNGFEYFWKRKPDFFDSGSTVDKSVK